MMKSLRIKTLATKKQHGITNENRKKAKQLFKNGLLSLIADLDFCSGVELRQADHLSYLHNKQFVNMYCTSTFPVINPVN
jgi:hypothetical protein